MGPQWASTMLADMKTDAMLVGLHKLSSIETSGWVVEVVETASENLHAGSVG
jgi:hypothetical protein